MKKLLAISVFAALLGGGLAWAQETTGAVIGTITSEDGATMPGVTVTIADPDTGFERTTVTNTAGEFRFVALPPATYALQATLDGFQTYKRDLAVSLGRTVKNDFTMSLGAVTDVIEVTGEAPMVDVDVHGGRPHGLHRRDQQPDADRPRGDPDRHARPGVDRQRQRLHRQQRRRDQDLHPRPAGGLDQRQLGGRELLPGQRAQPDQLSQRPRLELRALRVHGRGPGQDRRLRGRVRPRHRRRHQHGDQVRLQQLPRRRQRLLRAVQPAGDEGRQLPLPEPGRRVRGARGATPRSAARSSRTSCSTSRSSTTPTAATGG